MRLTLLFPDLPVTAAAVAELPRAPALELALGRGRTTVAAHGELAWLANLWQLADDAPWGALSLAGDDGEPGTHCWMRADPVHAAVSERRLVVDDVAALRLTASEAHAATDAHNAHFAADGLVFHPLRPDRWYLRSSTPPRLRCAPRPRTGGGCEVPLPEGDDALEWHRRLNEIQMLLHALPVNAAREARDELPVNSLWLWGLGSLPSSLPRPFAAVMTGEPVLAGLARTSGAACAAVPPSLAALPASATDDVLVRLGTADLAAPGTADSGQRLDRADRDWIAPALELLRARRLEALALVVCGADRTLTTRLSRHDLRRFWRRPLPLHRLWLP